ncbi:hypothetical protein G3570_13710 [Balneolaceae bacterium YR4-1]|uniref:arginine deiminase n=1 Tax=Halalkalibaculum roseum TaxID=2709311 RepID=A0A6M1SRH6_9BACT|nr:arginine deiminase family protein [Halalkalibaculum roseum]NGP77699.1 hypothetical protein [Halalkalibaculum roseum]
MKLNVTSETGRLKGVIVHTPGNEVSLVNPEHKDELLFDDIIFEEDAKQEHLDMLDIFKTAMPSDGQIYEITDLFLETLQMDEARNYFIDSLVDKLPELNLYVVKKELKDLSPKALLKFVIEGSASSGRFTLSPTPNLLFTRDLAAMVGENVLISKPAKKARYREALLMEALVRFHPMFEETNKHVIPIADQASIEGGDVLVASEKLVIIGMSERTSFSGLMTASKGLLESGIETVLAVDIPKQRSSMHLDTIFTFASEDECIVFPPAITERKNNIVSMTYNNGSITSETLPSLKYAMEKLMEREFTFIKCGGEDRTRQFREQWTDGANVFALAPGIIVGYERNTGTFQMLEEHGYTVMNQFDFIDMYKDREFEPGKEKIAISFLGHELCRGRGGARCMTMPIARTNL